MDKQRQFKKVINKVDFRQYMNLQIYKYHEAAQKATSKTKKLYIVINTIQNMKFITETKFTFSLFWVF